MMKKIGWIIFALLLVAFTCLYAVVDKNNGIYDQKIDSSEYISIELSKGEMLTQSFVSREEFLDGLNVKMSVTGVPEGKEISYVLKDSRGQEVALGKESLEDLQMGKYFAIKFERINDCKGQEFTLELTLSQSEDEGNVIVYDVPGMQEETELIVKGEKIDGTLALRTITHRFDVETFVVTVVFAVYVIIFVKWLGKVFK